jgi:F0F1-type ATP synthase beta subunit
VEGQDVLLFVDNIFRFTQVGGDMVVVVLWRATGHFSLSALPEMTL